MVSCTPDPDLFIGVVGLDVVITGVALVAVGVFTKSANQITEEVLADLHQ
ncbi:MAG: hypothetical protein L3J97_01805 [Thermoplasmata archaeon]|nr:hypothetical protein [Thermoplasmata archaeon]